MNKKQLKNFIRECISEQSEKPSYGDQIAIAFRKAKKDKNPEAMLYYSDYLKNTSAGVSFDRFKGSYAYEEWLKKPQTQEKLNKVKDELKRFSFMNESSLPPGFTNNDLESIDQFSKESEVNEEILDPSAATTVPPEEMDSYLNRIANKEKLDTDKYKYPYIHRSNIIGDNGKLLDQEKLKALIKVRPDKILKSNAKMQKSGGKDYIFFDISLPALRGLIVDESTNEFKIINTCPGAGACKVYCYAKKGGYVQWKASSLFQTRMINFLMNDWNGFKNKLISELESAVKRNSGKGIVLRWHDSGDFMSEKYLNIAYDIARQTPDIIHYAYTKNVGMVSKSDKPKNFVFNFSRGAIAPEEKNIDFEKDKVSIVVPKPFFSKYVHKDKESGKWVFNSPEELETFKKSMSYKYSIPLDTILTYDEMLAIPYDQNKSEENKYNVIVVPGDGDVSASRKDVRGTYLLMH